MASLPQGVTRGRYVARIADGAADIVVARTLRALVFRVDAGPGPDPWDTVCRHLLVEDAGGVLVCTLRFLIVPSGAAIGTSLSAQSYDLGALARFDRPMIEVGRFCIDPACRDGDILRVAWGALTRLVDDSGAGMLFGCASFQGADPARHADALALLGARHMAPAALAPRRLARDTVPLPIGGAVDAVRAARAMPPLLRTYLAMGGWVSDHAVVDAAMDTLHVFTAVDVAAIPPARARLLRAAAG